MTAMRIRVAVILLFLAAPLAAQEWRFFGRGAVFGIYTTETGPAQPRKQLFSTNWLEGHAERSFGRSSIELHARVTAEPATVPDEGYPLLLQYVSRTGADRMPAHEFLEDAGVRLWLRALRLDAAVAGTPPLGAEPYRQRSSSIDFPTAPFSYDVAESFKFARRVAGAAIDTRPLMVEGAVFHAGTTNGNIDSWSGRVTLRPMDAVSLQVSHGKLGDAKEPVTSASATWSAARFAATALWTKRDQLVAYGVEGALRGRRNTFMARIESADRPAGAIGPLQRRTTHISLGYIFDVAKRIGLGVATDYHTATGHLTSRYGHKPQSVHFFMRARTE